MNLKTEIHLPLNCVLSLSNSFISSHPFFDNAVSESKIHFYSKLRYLHCCRNNTDQGFCLDTVYAFQFSMFFFLAYTKHCRSTCKSPLSCPVEQNFSHQCQQLPTEGIYIWSATSKTATTGTRFALFGIHHCGAAEPQIKKKNNDEPPGLNRQMFSVTTTFFVRKQSHNNVCKRFYVNH